MSSTESLVVVAEDLRRRAGQLKPPYSTTAIIGACFPDTVVTGRALPKHVDELVTRTRDGGLIVYKRGLSGPEQRFAIAHGISHLLWDLEIDADACTVGFTGNPRCERRADMFGGELLAPMSDLARLVKRWPSLSSRKAEDHEAYLDQVDRIAAIFNLPQSVISERIRRLESTARMYGEIVLTD